MTAKDLVLSFFSVFLMDEQDVAIVVVPSLKIIQRFC